MQLFPRYAGPWLMDQICGVENMTLAWRRVRGNIQASRRRYSAGTDAVTLRDFEADWSNQMARLTDELRQGTYRPLPPRRVAIPKDSGGERAIAILAVRDRIAQRAVQQVLDPLFDPLFLDCSYGCRAHVGVHDAVARVARYAAQGMTWAVDADIASYFDSLDQRILMGLVRQRIDEPALLQLIGLWLQAGALKTAEIAPLAEGDRRRSALLERGGQALHFLLEGGARPMPQVAPTDTIDPYILAAGGPVDLSAWGAAAGPALAPRAPSLAERAWTTLMLAQPAIEGAKRALPYVQRIGGRRLVTAGMLAAAMVVGGEWALRSRAAGGRGTLQGGALSPLLANIYLHPFDVALTSQGLRLVRFMDDFVVMCASEAEARQAQQLVERQLAVLRLTLNAEKTRVVSYADGLEFLGQALAPRRRGQRLEDGLTSFKDAERALRKVAGTVRRKKQ